MDFSTILFQAHSGLRYLIILAGLLSLAYSLYSLASKRGWDPPGRIFLTAFVGLMDLQILMGITLAFVYVFYPALWGHLTAMILAAAVGHVAAARNKRRPPEPGHHWTAALGSAGAMALIVVGILAIGRPIM